MRVLITGGAGYIGSHTLLDILEDGHDAFVIDNYDNSSPAVLDRVHALSNRQFSSEQASILDASALDQIFADFKPEAVIHFAGKKAVGESEQIPLDYYDTNFGGSVALLKAMDRHNCKIIVFSSSATVYGTPHYLPYDENHPLAPVNPYGRTKYFIENLISDWAKTSSDKSAMLLRYFNPVGAHSSGQIGEDPSGIPNNLMPYIAQVAIGKRQALQVFGNDYDTRDGTGIRDYIHVTDLAEGHVAALHYAATHHGVEAVNLGTGNGVSVMEMITAFEKASGREIAFQICPRRAGDLPQFWADSQKAQSLLGWQADKTIDDMCQDVWRWQSQNPDGFA